MTIQTIELAARAGMEPFLLAQWFEAVHNLASQCSRFAAQTALRHIVALPQEKLAVMVHTIH
jgi:hypothetical protein